MKKASLFQDSRFQGQTYSHNNFGSSKMNMVKASMIFSRIECQPKDKEIQKKYIISKIAKANRHKIAQYQQRKRIVHPNILEIFLDQTSTFYATIRVEKGQKFQLKHLLQQQIERRNQFLRVILLTAKFLSLLYGFFYITEKMLLYRNSGEITLWINENILENYCSFPINHNKMSEQFFISDFVANFIGNLRQTKAIRKSTTIDSILCILHEEKNIFHSIYMSQSTHQMSQIQRKNSFANSSIVSCKRLGARYHRRQDLGSKEFHKGPNNMKKSISFSYLPYQIQKKINTIKKSQIRTLKNSISAQNLRERQLSSNNSASFHNLLNLSSSSKEIRSSNLPIVNFFYPKQSHMKEGQNKKKENLLNKQREQSINFMSESQSLGKTALFFQTSRSKQPLKVSNQNKISDYFIPFSSYENFPTTKQEKFFSCQKSEMKGKNIFDTKRQKQKNEKATQLQMDFQVLFSDSQGDIYSQGEMDTIMEEFQNILLS